MCRRRLLINWKKSSFSTVRCQIRFASPKDGFFFFFHLFARCSLPPPSTPGRRRFVRLTPAGRRRRGGITFRPSLRSLNGFWARREFARLRRRPEITSPLPPPDDVAFGSDAAVFGRTEMPRRFGRKVVVGARKMVGGGGIGG